MRGKAAIGCSNYKECGFKIPFELLGKKLTENNILELLEKGKTGILKGLEVPGSADGLSVESRKINGKLTFDSGFNIGIA